MKYTQYQTIQDFYPIAYPALMVDEAQNAVPLGNLVMGHLGQDTFDWRDPSRWLMATVSDENAADGGVALTAIMTPPYPITLYATGNQINKQAIDCLVAGLKSTPIPGVLAEKELAQVFTDAYTSRHGKTGELKESLRVHHLHAVSPQVTPAKNLRLVTQKDLHFFPYWAEDFWHMVATCNQVELLPRPNNMERYQHAINKQNVYIMEVDGQPVSMAALTKKMTTTATVGFVYTPPYFRGRGYATAIVAAISQQILDMGFKTANLFTDLANPISNSIYKKIGYDPICDYAKIEFI